MSLPSRLLLSAYGLAWKAATPLLRRNKRLSDGFADRLLPAGWPYDQDEGPASSGLAPLVWLQAASAGEARLIGPLLDSLVSLPGFSPPLTILCTTYTRQGMDVLEKLDQGVGRIEGLRLINRFFPLDHPSIMHKAVQAARPKAVVLLETELWPGLLHAAAAQSCPVLVVNGRMTGKSLSGYSWVPSFWKECAPAFILAVSPEDAGRFSRLFGRERVQEMPNIKFDSVGSAAEPQPIALAGRGYPVAAFASVREEEEDLLLPVVGKVLGGDCRQDVRPLAVIAPRHMHRVPAWREKLGALGLEVCLRSDMPGDGFDKAEIARPMGSQVLLWDTFGELDILYSGADAVFVGGSLAPLGGQNFLEPLALGLIPVVGPHLDNFLWVGKELFNRGLVRKVGTAEELAEVLLEQLQTAVATWSSSSPDGNGPSENRRQVREEFFHWLLPKKGGSVQAAREVLKYIS